MSSRAQTFRVYIIGLLILAGCGDDDAKPRTADSGVDGGAAEDSGVCADCPDSLCAQSGCAPGQSCVVQAGEILCEDGKCEPGFALVSGSCEPIEGASCLGAGDISAACASIGRTCDDSGPSAVCGGCLAGLEEVDSRCVADPCVASGCQDVHRECAGGATCGGCLVGYEEVGGECIATSCETCDAEYRKCDATSGTPTCTECLAGYGENAAGSCVQASTCADLDCAAAMRTCSEVPLGCDDACVEGYVWEESTRTCKVPLTCAELVCGAAEVCFQDGAESDAYCATGCPDGKGEFPNGDGTYRCVTCTGLIVSQATCSRTGETGALVSEGGTEGNNCFCKTEPGYLPDLDNRAIACDEDGDGWVIDFAWVRKENAPSQSYAENTRCSVRQVEAFRLVPDAASGADLVATEESTLSAYGAPLPLYESQANDKPLRDARPLYATNAVTDQTLPGIAVNSLTKACIGTQTVNNSGSVVDVDINTNGIQDVLEAQDTSAAKTFNLPQAMVDYYGRYSYFIELHHGYFEPSAPGSNVGTYVIEERPRALEALGGVSIAYEDPANTSTYWRECERQDDALSCDTTIGADFSCATKHGSSCTDDCGRSMFHHSQFRCVLGTTSYVGNAETNPTIVEQLGIGQEGFAKWNADGLTHRLGPASVCELTGATTSVGGTGIANPKSLEFNCQRTDIVVNGVKAQWSVADYINASTDPSTPPSLGYRRGCINECDERGVEACPTYVEGRATEGFQCDQSAARDFGRIECGCDTDFSGLATSCGMACSSVLVRNDGGNGSAFLSPGMSALDRGDTNLWSGTDAGYWMCLDAMVTATEDGANEVPIIGGNGYMLRGGISAGGGNFAEEIGAGRDSETGQCLGYCLSSRARTEVAEVVNP